MFFQGCACHGLHLLSKMCLQLLLPNMAVLLLIIPKVILTNIFWNLLNIARILYLFFVSSPCEGSTDKGATGSKYFRFDPTKSYLVGWSKGLSGKFAEK